VLDRELTQSEFGELVGISQPAVSSLVSRGILKVGRTGGGWLKAYCDHLREEAAGRAGDLASASAELKRSQRAMVELQLAEKRKQVLPVGVLSQLLALAGRRVSVVLEALPADVRMRCPELSADALAQLEGALVRARNAMAGVTLEELEALEAEEEDTD
jgi:phage terminase Nu1 subunit (DNA packaging protein)